MYLAAQMLLFRKKEDTISRGWRGSRKGSVPNLLKNDSSHVLVLSGRGILGFSKHVI